MQSSIEIPVLKNKNKEIIFVIGGPGSGKGTQCNLLEKRRGFHHISVGELIRKVFKEKSSEWPEDFITKLKESLKRGDLLDDQLSIDLIKKEMQKHQEAKGFLIDGCPRTLKQLELFENTIQPCTQVLYLKVDQKIMKERMLLRHQVEHRPDDTRPAIERRIQRYRQETEPVICYLITCKKNNFIEIDASRSIEEVTQAIEQALNPSLYHIGANDFLSDFIAPKKVVSFNEVEKLAREKPVDFLSQSSSTSKDKSITDDLKISMEGNSIQMVL